MVDIGNSNPSDEQLFTQGKLVHGLYINGHWQAGMGDEFRSVEPASQQIVWQGHAASIQQTNQAIEAASQAFTLWRCKDISERLLYIHRFEQLIRIHNNALALAICDDTGRPLWDSLQEVENLIGNIQLAFEAHQQRAGGRVIPLQSGHIQLKHRPHGALTVICSSSMPALLSCGQIIPSLLAGNTVIYKPSERTPKVAEYLMKLWQQTEIPDGVINLIQGSANVASHLCSHCDISGVLFTGKTSTGITLNQQLAHQPNKLVSLQMSANNPLIVDEVNNLSAAAYQVIYSAFVSTGQRCTNIKRLYIPDSHFGDELTAQLIEYSHSLIIGRYDEQPAPFMGPMLNIASAKQVVKQQQNLLSCGANVLLSANQAEEKSAFLSPGLLDITHMKRTDDCEYDEEIFGPVLQIHRYKDFDQAIELANQSKFGLAASLISDKENHFLEFDRHICAGVITWNHPITGMIGAAPFGGIGLSGNHRSGNWYAADYCSYPATTMYQHKVSFPSIHIPGIPQLDQGT